MPTIDPIAFHLGPLKVHWYGIILATAMLVGTILAARDAQRRGVDPDHLYNLALIMIPGAIICARIYYVFFNWQYYSVNPWEIPAIWHGGLAIHGGILGGLLVGYLYARHYKLEFWLLADIVAPSLVLGQAIGRWGNYVNQEAYGTPTDLPWAMYIAGEYRHPTFLYESIWNLGVFLFLLWQRKKNQRLKTGDLFLIYLILYSLGRVWVESFRTDSLMLGPLKMAQLISLFFIGLGAVLLYLRHKKPNQGKEPLLK